MKEKQLGLQGSAVVVFVVDKEGNVRDARVSQASGPGFAKSALDAIVQWKFEPGQRDGQPVAAAMMLPMVFSLRE